MCLGKVGTAAAAAEFVKGYKQCKECIAKYKAEHYKNNKKKYKNNHNSYYKNNKEKILNNINDYYKTHKNQIINDHKEYRKRNRIKVRKYMRNYGRMYDKKYPGRHAARWRKRRAKQLGVNENYSEEDRQYTINLFNNHCANCGTTERLTIDHHQSLEHGNPLTRQNAVLLCLSCNCSKGIKKPEEFYTQEKLLLIEQKLGIK